MSSPAPPMPNSAPGSPTNPAATPEGELPPAEGEDLLPLPPEEEFWVKYNHHFEFPFSAVGAVLLHLLVVVGIYGIMWKTKNAALDKNLPVVISPVSGLDTEDGAPGAGEGDGEKTPEERFEPPPIPPEDVAKLPDIQKTLEDVVPDPSIIPKDKLADFANLDKDLQNKLARGDGTHGKGPGGMGHSSAAAQSFRWTLRFRTRNGRDYIYQLSILQAKILIPLPPDNKKCMLYENLSADPPKGRPATDEDLKQLAGQLRFSDRSPDSVRSVAGALGMDETPRLFYAFLPGELRLKLAQMEKDYAGADLKDIEETVINMNVGGGKYDPRIIEQRLRGGKVIRK